MAIDRTPEMASREDGFEAWRSMYVDHLVRLATLCSRPRTTSLMRSLSCGATRRRWRARSHRWTADIGQRIKLSWLDSPAVFWEALACREDVQSLGSS